LRLTLSRRSLTVIALGLPVAVAMAVAAPQMASAAAPHHVTPGQTSAKYWTTFYGWADNSPPGPAIAYTGCTTPGGQKVTSDVYSGSNGSYNDPIVMAWPTDLKGPWCQIGYVPDLQKYYIHADQCDPCGGVNTDHWDLWMGGNAASTKNPEHKALESCEDKWTVHQTVILSPSSTEPVDTTPLFTPPTTCLTPTD
jgi:hypothetical protein